MNRYIILAAACLMIAPAVSADTPVRCDEVSAEEVQCSGDYPMEDGDGFEATCEPWYLTLVPNGRPPYTLTVQLECILPS